MQSTEELFLPCLRDESFSLSEGTYVSRAFLPLGRTILTLFSKSVGHYGGRTFGRVVENTRLEISFIPVYARCDSSRFLEKECERFVL